MSGYLLFEVISMVALTTLLLIDVLVISRKPHIPSAKESTAWVVFYAALALIFFGILFATGERDRATEFLAGWLTEYSLSIDNLFVFVIIMTRFSVPKKYQQEVLMVGVIMALVLPMTPLMTSLLLRAQCIAYG